ncbi:MAG TPA: hypothetical protein VLF21_01460 [Candidatus Saccharimonadales bacterium]|nr:hypothetical protein [Candidatus Saccharimonadales bacterium]
MKLKVTITVAALALLGVAIVLPRSIQAAKASSVTNCIKAAALINDRSSQLEKYENTQKSRWLAVHRRYGGQVEYASQWLRDGDLTQAKKDLSDYTTARAAFYREVDVEKAHFAQYKTKPVNCASEKSRLKDAVIQARKDRATLLKAQRAVADTLHKRVQPDVNTFISKLHDAKRARVTKHQKTSVLVPSQ